MVKAQVDLAGAYLLGNGVRRNATTAGEWLLKPQRQGMAKRRCSSACCASRRGREQDIAQGMEWLGKARYIAIRSFPYKQRVC